MSTDITGPIDGDFPCGTPGKRELRGNPARWNETAKWIDRDGLPLPSSMLVAGFTTELRCWKDKKLEKITEHPLPDPAELNAAIPISEWEIGLDGRPRAPWALTYVVYLIDLDRGALYTYANSTFGARLLYENLEEQVTVMRMIRGNHVLPIVRLEQRPMKTQYGMKARPHLHIYRLACAGRWRWWSTQAGITITDSTNQRAEYANSDTNSDANSDANSNRSYVNSGHFPAGPCASCGIGSIIVTDPRSHAAGEAGHRGRTHRR
jgi:hypothetical protein